ALQELPAARELNRVGDQERRGVAELHPQAERDPLVDPLRHRRPLTPARASDHGSITGPRVSPDYLGAGCVPRAKKATAPARTGARRAEPASKRCGPAQGRRGRAGRGSGSRRGGARLGPRAWAARLARRPPRRGDRSVTDRGADEDLRRRRRRAVGGAGPRATRGGGERRPVVDAGPSAAPGRRRPAEAESGDGRRRLAAQEPLEQAVEVVEVGVADLDAAALAASVLGQADLRAERLGEPALHIAHRGALLLRRARGRRAGAAEDRKSGV